MQNNKFDLYNFIALYNLIMFNLRKDDNQFKIDIYYLDSKFNIKISTMEKIVFDYNFKCSKDDYDYLVNLLTNSFIDEHEISLPVFDKYADKEIVKMYYKSEDQLKNPFNYDKFVIHKLRNTKFEFNIYYFHGLTDFAQEIQHKALDKLNSKTLKKSKEI